MQLTELNEQFKKTMNFMMSFGSLPIKPADFVILAIGIAVSSLGSAKFIAGQNHWNAMGKQIKRRQVFCLAQAKRVNFFRIGWAFMAAIPAQIVVALGCAFYYRKQDQPV